MATVSFVIFVILNTLVVASATQSKEPTVEKLSTDNTFSFDTSCLPEDVILSDFKQWGTTKGYWIGEYTLLGPDGNPSVSEEWNYPYDHYKGFITSNTEGNQYRQRNVFMYPPQAIDVCTGDNNSTFGDGVCGVNGNTLMFQADQKATTCDFTMPGYIEGPYGSLQYTYTELVGQDNALVYQVFLTKDALNYYESTIMGNPFGRCDENGDCGYTDDRMMQSQLTTLTQLPDGTDLRTRTAQGFDAFGNVGAPTYASFYRERKVDESEFWEVFNETLNAYNILDADICGWISGDAGNRMPSGDSGLDACERHLEESFDME